MPAGARPWSHAAMRAHLAAALRAPLAAVQQLQADVLERLQRLDHQRRNLLAEALCERRDGVGGSQPTKRRLPQPPNILRRQPAKPAAVTHMDKKHTLTRQASIRPR